MWGATAFFTVDKQVGYISIHAPRVGRDVLVTPQKAAKALFQSTRPVWGATLLPWYIMWVENISIHAPRVGRDNGFASIVSVMVHFNPRAPCGARPPKGARMDGGNEFQSTRPVWGATVTGLTFEQAFGISIHAPRVGRDAGRVFGTVAGSISIHAPRVGRDKTDTVDINTYDDFNPRAPCGARQQI